MDNNTQIDSSESRKLSDLKVTDLRNELEIRNQDKTGVKAVLVERLSNVLREEGHDPDEFLFSTSNDNSKPGPMSKRKSTPSKIALKEDENEVIEEQEGTNTSDAADVVKEALNLQLDDDLNEWNDKSSKTTNHKSSHNNSKTMIQDPEEELNHEHEDQDPDEEAEENQKVSDEQKMHEENGHEGSPHPEKAPVVNPLTADDMLNIAAAQRKPTPDDVSLIVHVDDTQSELDVELAATASTKPNDGEEKKETKKSEPSSDSTKKSSKESSSKSSKEKKSDKKTSEKRSSTPKDSTSKSGGNAPSDRSVWVSGLSQNTRASDLQTLFQKHGRVTGAKIITNTKIPGSRYYGLITMETREQAEECIKNLHRTELNGRTIAVERTRKPEEKSSRSEKKTKDTDKEKDKKRSDDSRRREKRKSRDRSPRRVVRRPIPARPFVSRPPFRPRPISPGMIRQLEVERVIRRREREREMRESERRRMEITRQREMERKQMEERDRLEREKEKLRIEREKLDREKAELLRLEREKARLEREKIEREKEELRRRLQRTEEMSRRAVPAVSMKRTFDSREGELYWSDPSLVPRLYEMPARTYQEFDRPMPSSDGRGDGFMKRKLEPVTRPAEYGDSRREGPRPGHIDREDRRTAMSNTYADRSAVQARERDRRPAAREDFRMQEPRRDRVPALDSRPSRLPPALNQNFATAPGHPIHQSSMFPPSSGMSAMVSQSMPGLAPAERSYIHSIRRF